MISPLDTKVAFFGGAANTAAVQAVIKLADAGYDVVTCSHDPREAVLLRDAGISFVDDRYEAVEGCQVVITSLRGPDDVEALYLGESGLLELMSPGSYAIDLTFSTPQLAREVAAVAAISDIEVVDAPIVALGEKEQPIAFVGGSPETLELLSPLFPFLAPAVMPQSDAGEGQLAAMIAYISLAGALMGAVEALSVARIAGFSESAAINVLASSAGGSRALVDYVPRMLAYDYTGNIKVSTLLDVLDVALDAAEALDVTVPMVETAYQLYELLSLVGGDELNIQALALLYEDEQTCANYGLDWSLADSASDADDFDDFMGGHGGSGSGCGHGGHGIDGFFSKN